MEPLCGWYAAKQKWMILPDLNKDTLLFKSGKIIHLGPSGETQTLGLADPNRAFYQLNYTQIFSFLHNTMRRKKKQVFRVCGRRCGQTRFCERFSTVGFPPQATVPRTSGISLLRGMDRSSIFPNKYWKVFCIISACFFAVSTPSHLPSITLWKCWHRRWVHNSHGIYTVAVP